MARSNITINQGADASFIYTVTDDNDNILDLNSYTGAAQMRKHYSSLNAHSFSVSIDGNNGVVSITMNAATTGAITYGRYVYDCEITSNTGTVTRIVEGIATVNPQVTKI
jgi:hypothetical protein